MAREVCTIIGEFALGREPAGWDGRDPMATIYDDGVAVIHPVVRGGIAWQEHLGTPDEAREALARDWGSAEIEPAE